MSPELKIELLQRWFLSEDYFELFHSHYYSVIFTIKEGLKRFQESDSKSDWQIDAAKFWESSVLPCWEHGLNRLAWAQESVRRHQIRPMLAFTADLHEPFEELGYLSPALFAWWPDENSRRQYEQFRELIEQEAINIHRSLNHSWTPAELLNPPVVDPFMDYQDLVRYMEIGDSAKYNSYLQETHPDD